MSRPDAERIADGGIERTFAFVDLAGFTALTEVHGDEHAADLVERFTGIARDALGPGDRLVKSIGDAVLLTAPGPAAGLTLVRRVFEACRSTPDFPVPRAGVHHGPAVERGGDVFGAAVNLAARVTGQAAGGQVVVTAPVVVAATELGLDVISLGRRGLRNLAEPVELFDVRLWPRSDTVLDPVCRMRVDPVRAAGRLRHAGTDWWFCSLACVARFAEDPARYAART